MNGNILAKNTKSASANRKLLTEKKKNKEARDNKFFLMMFLKHGRWFWFNQLKYHR